jgi:hypothetical protein
VGSDLFIRDSKRIALARANDRIHSLSEQLRGEQLDVQNLRDALNRKEKDFE